MPGELTHEDRGCPHPPDRSPGLEDRKRTSRPGYPGQAAHGCAAAASAYMDVRPSGDPDTRGAAAPAGASARFCPCFGLGLGFRSGPRPLAVGPSGSPCRLRGQFRAETSRLGLAMGRSRPYGIIHGYFPHRTGSPMSLFASLAPTAVLAAASPQGGGFGMLLFPVILIAIMYFLMIRPQMKRQKEHQAMLGKLQRGDEVLTNSGIAGVVTEIGENFVTVEIADNVRIRVQKAAIGNVLPKGTLKGA